MPMTEQDLRDALRPLRETEPTDADVARALAAAPEPAPRPVARRALRPALAIGGATLAAVAVVAALPGGSSDPAGPPSARSVLESAAATAAGARPAPIEGYRYSDTRLTFVYRDRAADGRTASTTFTQPVRSWLNGERRGRDEYGAVRDLRRTGDRRLLRLQPQDLRKPGRYAATPGDVNTSAARVPDDAAAARRYLDERVRTQIGGRAPGAVEVRYERTRSALYLLGSAPLRPSQRAALFGVLATTERVATPGLGRDALGRRGRVVTFALDGREGVPRGALRAVFDPESAELLSWSLAYGGTDSNGGVPDQDTVYVRGGQVDRVGEIPPRTGG